MTDHRFVESIPDLIHPDEYADHPEGRLVRLRLEVSEDGVEIVGDAFRPALLEPMLRQLSTGGDIEQMLCG